MKILLVAGEASGDLHGANLVREIKRLNPHIRFFGVGGEHMQIECEQILFDCKRLGVVGLIEVFSHLTTIRNCFKILTDFIKKEKPDLLVLIDYPDFNLRFAKVAKKLGIRVIYYISPQIWAWRKGRVKFIAEWVDKMLVIFPFEIPFYKNAGVDVEFVGHPLLDSVSPKVSQESFKMRFGLNKGERIIALMPGSRKGEVARILPVMLDGAKKLTRDDPGAWRFLLILAPTIDRKLIDSIMEKCPEGLSISVVQGYTYEALKAAELAFVTSGTATLEASIIGTPMILLYKLSWFTYFIARMMIKLPHIGLVNIVAGEDIVPELIQKEANGDKLAEAARDLLGDPQHRYTIMRGMAKVREALGKPGATIRAANAVLRTLDE